MQNVADAGATTEAGLTALVLIARLHGMAADPAQIRHQAGLGEREFGEDDLLRAAKRLGLKAKIVQCSAERLQFLSLPALIFDTDGNHFILAKVSNDKALIQEANHLPPRILSCGEVLARGTGRALVAASRASLVGELARFDFSWFIP